MRFADADPLLCLPTRSALAEAARIEATALAEVSFGGPMLHAIGYVYVNKADQFLGNPLVCGSISVSQPY